MDADALIQEQIDYYRRRAGEYDETSSPTGDPLAVFVQDIEHALHAFKPTGDVLELQRQRIINGEVEPWVTVHG